MKNIQYAWSGIKFHKKMYFSLFLLTSISLFILSILTFLKNYEANRLATLKDKWNTLDSATSYVKLKGLDPLITVHKKVLETYNFGIKLCILLFLVVCIIFIVITVIHRRKELIAFQYLQAKPIKIAFHAALENLLVIFMSYIFICAIFLLFQNPIASNIPKWNNACFDQNSNGDVIIKASVNQEKNRKAIKDSAVLETAQPFDKRTIEATVPEKEITYPNVLYFISTNFLLIATMSTLLVFIIIFILSQIKLIR